MQGRVSDMCRLYKVQHLECEVPLSSGGYHGFELVRDELRKLLRVGATGLQIGSTTPWLLRELRPRVST